MSHHIADDLPRLLTGEANREETLAAAEHLRGCPDCQQELVSAVVAHASLSSVQRFAREVISPADDGERTEPGMPLPDLSEVFARARTEAAQAAKPWRRHRRLLAIAAAAAVAAGIGVTIAETVGSTSGSCSTQRTIDLAPFGEGHQPAEATLACAGTMRIDASALPRLDAQHFYEVWLTDPARMHLQAVGSIGNDNQAQLTISPKVMSQYSAIEISVQQLRQTSYSGHSVLRGSYS